MKSKMTDQLFFHYSDKGQKIEMTFSESEVLGIELRSSCCKHRIKSVCKPDT